MKKKDDKIIFHHQKKDLKALESSLHQLKKEHDEIKNNLDLVNYLLNLIEKLAIENSGDFSGIAQNTTRSIKGLGKTKQVFEKLYLKAFEKLKPADTEFIINEKAKLVGEKENLEKQLNHLNILIAKTEVFLSDVRDHLCSELTKGHDLVAVGQKLHNEFGDKITASFYSTGRVRIIKFLEHAFLLNRIKSNFLFELLQDGKIIKYHVNVLDYSPLSHGFSREGADFFPVEANWVFSV